MSKYEYAAKIDCVAQGCKPHHSDDGVILWANKSVRGQVPKVVNGHALKIVRRLIGDWEDDPGEQEV